MAKWREVAKFFSGAFAWDFIGHSFLAVSGDLPIPLSLFTLIPELNFIIVIANLSLFCLCAFVGWIKK